MCNDLEQNNKEPFRKAGYRARHSLKDKCAVSDRIIQRVVHLPEFQRAQWVMWYVSTRSEVQTHRAIAEQLSDAKKIAVPFCEGGTLRLFHLESLAELESGAYKILEPKVELRQRSGKVVRPEQLDFLCVPGVAFDRRGGRVGNGKGYYDRFLQTVPQTANRIGLAYECQIFDRIVVEEHDILMHHVVTENRVYTCD
ncbi:putative 5-formyltetrahydrofolate cyclo-ligase [Novipirellula aureliae]|uniref:5-formyltetrahydrofolate cyclo-ligase n=1 Tax=Novipirellula aureliae TaxID=2527966 RepID=A0A5C6E4R5_9BACT|nr:5-formyltetrahydrofolate cyclo-ligase [Novipirellula aureliae]TWU42987.1 putative 5-formyltetrahydrofolate cyclo-ligase [Novipirellula aureliae]